MSLLPKRTFKKKKGSRAFTLKRKQFQQKDLLSHEHTIVEYIQLVLGERKDPDVSLGQWLADGIILCRLTNAIHPNAISHFHKEPTARFQMVANINIFICACQGLSLFKQARTSTFAPLDLIEQSNMKAVVDCLYALSQTFPKAKENPKLANSIGSLKNETPRPLRARFPQHIEPAPNRTLRRHIGTPDEVPTGIRAMTEQLPEKSSSTIVHSGSRRVIKRPISNRSSTLRRNFLRSKLQEAESYQSAPDIEQPGSELRTRQENIKKPENTTDSRQDLNETPKKSQLSQIMDKTKFLNTSTTFDSEDEWDTLQDDNTPSVIKERDNEYYQPNYDDKGDSYSSAEQELKLSSYGLGAYCERAEDSESEGTPVFGTPRGKCQIVEDGVECLCKKYYHAEGIDEGGPCLNCGHYPVKHKDMSLFGNNMFVEKSWVIEYNQLELNVQIGNGAFGEVWQGKLWGGDVAIKRINKSALGEDDPLVLKDFAQEISVLSSIRHPNCVLFIAATLSPPLCIVTELFNRGSLQDVLSQVKIKPQLTWERRVGFAIDACLGIIYLHQLDIIHRDLKSGNFLVDNNWRVAVADFGLSIIGELESGSAGTLGYMAPELIKGAEASPASDCFSFGMVLWEIFTGEILLDHLDSDPLVVEESIIAGERPFLPPVIPIALSNLIEKCWHGEPECRPMFEEICIELKRLRENQSGAVNVLYGESATGRSERAKSL